jgi:hypothetical protein
MACLNTMAAHVLNLPCIKGRSGKFMSRQLIQFWMCANESPEDSLCVLIKSYRIGEILSVLAAHRHRLLTRT